MTTPTVVPLQANAEVDVHEPDTGDERFWSVTTIIGTLGSKEGLIEWTAQESGRVAIRRRRTWQSILDEDGEDAAVAWIAQERFKTGKGERSATKLGSAVHAACELYVVTGKRPVFGEPLGPDLGDVDDEVLPYLDTFELFLDRFSPAFTAAEYTVYDTRYRYAGTADGAAVVDGVPVIIDYKTSKKSFDGQGRRKRPWVDVALQLAAYRHAEIAAVWRARKFERYSRRYYLLNADEKALAVPVPHVDGGIVVHLTPEHCDVYPVDCGPDVHEAFLYSIESARWSFETSKRVLGEPLALLDKKG